MSISIKIIEPTDWDILRHKMHYNLESFDQILDDIDTGKWSSLVRHLHQKQQEVEAVIDFINSKSKYYSLDEWKIWEQAQQDKQDK